IDLGFVLYFAGQEQEALRWIDSAKTTSDPHHPAYTDLSRVYLYTNHFQQVLEVSKKYRTTLAASELWPRMDALDAIAYFRLGRMEAAQERLTVLKDIASKTPNGSAAFYAA